MTKVWVKVAALGFLAPALAGAEMSPKGLFHANQGFRVGCRSYTAEACYIKVRETVKGLDGHPTEYRVIYELPEDRVASVSTFEAAETPWWTLDEDERRVDYDYPNPARPMRAVFFYDSEDGISSYEVPGDERGACLDLRQPASGSHQVELERSCLIGED